MRRFSFHTDWSWVSRLFRYLTGRKTMKTCLLWSALVFAGCANLQQTGPSSSTRTNSGAQTSCSSSGACQSDQVPDFLLGRWEDDYEINYMLTSTLWTQFPNSSYQVLKWNTPGEYLIAQNASSNPSGGGLWTRIDWMKLNDMAPYEWAFCISAYEEITPYTADLVTIADRSNPKSGCNGHPFSRMKRVD
jgi:hypothetical protein